MLGIHKHFHLLSLHQYLLSHGYIHPSAPHTRIPSIWTKLDSLYDLAALDEREDAHSTLFRPEKDSEAEEEGEETVDSQDEVDSEAAGGLGEGFELPDEEFGDMMWGARFATDADTVRPSRETRSKDPDVRPGSFSPPQMPPDLIARRHSPPVRFTPTIDTRGSADPREEEVTPSKAGRKPGRPAKGTTRGPRGESKPGARESTGRRRTRAADSAATEEEAEEEEDKEEEADEEADGEEEESVEESSEEESGTPAPKTGKGRGGTKAARGRPPSRASKRKR